MMILIEAGFDNVLLMKGHIFDYTREWRKSCRNGKPFPSQQFNRWLRS
uniref:Alternative protein ZBTB11 n=1 Tax=Homo sapiens TaxID=9606 RepID=L8E8H7_HUMAN|nr:alternative protein ZBTB11 [Homo sapiens]